MSIKARIEAVLFITAQALEVKDIAEILKEDETVVEEALLELIMDYSAREGALEIDDENGYILQVKEDYMDIVEQLCPVELKPAVLKTLTIIALKEPIRQSYLKELRSNAYEHVQELLKMGAKINVSERYATVVGVQKLKPAEVVCPDLRGGAGLVLAGLVAKGKTVVDKIYHIERGYYNLDLNLKSLGAIIDKVE